MILLSSFTTVKFGKTLIKLWVDFDKNLVLGNQRVVVGRKRPFLGAFSRVFRGVGDALLLITFLAFLALARCVKSVAGRPYFLWSDSIRGLPRKSWLSVPVKPLALKRCIVSPSSCSLISTTSIPLSARCLPAMLAMAR